MSLTQLNIHALRNIKFAQLELNPRFNLFTGPNGSGKTSLLEALYLLSRGHSFRTRESAQLITHGQPTLTVFARTDKENSISIQKHQAGSTRVKLNQHTCLRSSELAHLLPCQVFYQDIFQIIDAGPAMRRNVLNWGLFHVKQSYHQLWQDYARVLKQRNALLRRKAPSHEFTPWDIQLVELAEAIDAFRKDYIQEWSEQFQAILKQLTSTSCTLEYYKGWGRKNKGSDLRIVLEEQFARDQQQQYTHAGAHQADLIITSEAVKAKHVLSRGQQKIILIALKLAQAQFITRPCIYLFDDLTAELDFQHLARILKLLNETTGQFFITAIDAGPLFSELPPDHFSYVIDNGTVAK